LKRKIKEGKERELIERLGIGGMSGIGGVIYGLYSIGKLLQDDSFFDNANTLIDALRQTDIKRDRKYDLMGGSAGLLLALLSTPHPKSLELATACGEHLIRNGKEKKGESLTSRGKILSWTKAGLGCSHGAAGIAYSLLKLYEKTKKPSFQIGAQKAVLYERAFYSKEHQNWPRFDTKKESYSLSWCSGAPGIGLCRQASLALDEDPLYKQEIATALEITQKNWNEKDACLCCGLSGQFELITAVSKCEAEKKIPFIIKKIGMELAIMDTDLFIPGFMKGVSGMGYTLLRMLDTEKKLPQVLLLE
jgi:lantibiotic modifying enzyme